MGSFKILGKYAPIVLLRLLFVTLYHHSYHNKSSAACYATKQQLTHTKSELTSTRWQKVRFSLLFLSSAYTFSVSKSMMCRINLSLLCVALTRQSSGFMADWICVIKDDKQNHLLVISICHHPAFAISRTSLKNNSESRKKTEKREKSAYTAMPQREVEEGGGEQRELKVQESQDREREKQTQPAKGRWRFPAGYLWANLLMLPHSAHWWSYHDRKGPTSSNQPMTEPEPSFSQWQYASFKAVCDVPINTEEKKKKEHRKLLDTAGYKNLFQNVRMWNNQLLGEASVFC